MTAIDESDLIDFFSALPQRQPAEEAEFFAAPCFVKVVDGIRLEFSASAHFDDVRLHLQLDGSDVPLVESVLHDVESMAIELDSDAREWIHARSRTGQEIRLAVEPSISVQLTAGRSTT